MDDLGKHIKVHVPNLIKEIAENNKLPVLHIPLLAFRDLLAQVATRASQINDVELNKLMMKLALYEIADPESSEYNSEFVTDYINQQ